MRFGIGRWIRAWLAILSVAVVVGASSTHAQTGGDVPDLDPERRVYDETGSSLDAGQIASLERQIASLEAIGADVIVYVRARDATPDETLEQVEALQQAWVALTGADQDTAVAMLINRNPDDPNDARAGIYVGRTYHEGNVPESEQRAIVSDALIPPLREGNVYGSFSAALDRLESSIQFGPPRNAFERWSDRVADGWFPWANVALAVLAGFGATRLFRQREHLDRAVPTPTTARPGNLTPALAGALVAGGPQVSAIPATILDLAGRGALWIEPERQGGRFSQPAVQVRLRDRDLVRDEVEVALLRQLDRRAEHGVVSSKNLARIAADFKDVRTVLDNQMNANGWKDPRAPRNKGVLWIVVVIAIGLFILNVAVAVSAGSWLAAIGAVAMAALAIAAGTMAGTYSSLTRAGQEAALPWKAYRKGLEAAAKDPTVVLDLDETLPDIVAMNQGAAMDKRLKEATEAGLGFRAFRSSFDAPVDGAPVAYFPFWVAFNSSVATSSGTGASSATVSAGGAGGGGGAAGST